MPTHASNRRWSLSGARCQLKGLNSCHVLVNNLGAIMHDGGGVNGTAHPVSVDLAVGAVCSLLQGHNKGALPMNIARSADTRDCLLCGTRRRAGNKTAATVGLTLLRHSRAALNAENSKTALVFHISKVLDFIFPYIIIFLPYIIIGR